MPYILYGPYQDNHMNNIDKYISAKVRKYRKDKGLTQQEMADMLDLSRASIVNIESGRQSFTTRNIYLMACIFNCPVSDLFPEVMPATIEKTKKRVVKTVVEHRFKATGLPKVKKVKTKPKNKDGTN